jgi:hypothetical protein
MPTYTVPGPDGKEYYVDASDPGEAGKLMHQHLVAQTAEQAKSDYADAPFWAKGLKTADDAVRAAVDTASMGMFDKLLGGQEDVKTAAARQTSPIATTVGDVAGGMALPTGAPGLVAKVGGGPIVRGVTGMLGAGATGGAQGAVSAAVHDQPVVEGAVQGILGGAGGQALAGAAAPVVNKATKLVKGIDDALPAAASANVPGKAPNPARRVEAAAARAEQAGGTPSDYVREFKAMNQNKLPADVLADVRTITHGDPGTAAAKVVGGLAQKAADKGGLGAGFSSGDPIIGLLTAGGLYGGGAASKMAAGQGTTEAVEQLRRKLLGIPKYQGLVSKEAADQAARFIKGSFMSSTGE